MWTFCTRTGDLYRDGQHEGRGYSGYDDGDGIQEPGEGKNDPLAEARRGVGPIPRGRWKIVGPPFDRLGSPYCLGLVPEPGTETFGRSAFLVHGDSIKNPGSASHGCIVLSRYLRRMLWESGDHDLNVVADPLEAAA